MLFKPLKDLQNFFPGIPILREKFLLEIYFSCIGTETED